MAVRRRLFLCSGRACEQGGVNKGRERAASRNVTTEVAYAPSRKRRPVAQSGRSVLEKPRPHDKRARTRRAQTGRNLNEQIEKILREAVNVQPVGLDSLDGEKERPKMVKTGGTGIPVCMTSVLCTKTKTGKRFVVRCV